VVRLPLEAARQRPRPAPQRDHRWGMGHFISGVRVLVADDEPDARELTRVVLESSGGHVVAVASAGEALNALRQQSFDALVADIGMPGQDGYSLIRAIRTLPAGAGGSIPAVAVTAYTSVREREEALTAGFNAHMGKPVDPEQLVATIAAAVNAARIR
jgi:CheY-like chemotaxis protein